MKGCSDVDIKTRKIRRMPAKSVAWQLVACAAGAKAIQTMANTSSRLAACVYGASYMHALQIGLLAPISLFTSHLLHMFAPT